MGVCQNVWNFGELVCGASRQDSQVTSKIQSLDFDLIYALGADPAISFYFFPVFPFNTKSTVQIWASGIDGSKNYKSVSSLVTF